MSEYSPDERDIDDILASIDEMLKQKDTYFEDWDKKAKIREAAVASEQVLGMSTSVAEDKPTDQKTRTTDHDAHVADAQYLLISEDLRESSEQALSEQMGKDFEWNDDDIDFAADINADAPTDAEINLHNDNDAAPSDAIDQPEQNADDYEKHPSFSAFDLGQLDSNTDEERVPEASGSKDDSHQAQTPDQELSVATPRHRILLTEALLEHSKQTPLPLWLDKGDANHIDPDTQPPSPPVTDVAAEAPNNPAEDIQPDPSASQDNISSADFEAVFDAIANDDTITFDISEIVDEDTVYDIETITEQELVEAMLSDIVADPAHDVSDTEAPVFSELDATVAAAKAAEAAAKIEEETILPYLSEAEVAKISTLVAEEISQNIAAHIDAVLPDLIQAAIAAHIRAATPNTDDTEY